MSVIKEVKPRYKFLTLVVMNIMKFTLVSLFIRGSVARNVLPFVKQLV